MAFCKFTSDYALGNTTHVDNIFVTEFLPKAPATHVKVYLFGLFKCFNAEQSDNNLERFAKILDLTEDQVFSAFEYWENEGLVQIVREQPFRIKYIPLKSVATGKVKYNLDENSDFNIQVQEILSGRMITANEYHEIHSFLASMHVDKDAFKEIAKYCTKLKSNKIAVSYVLAVAKNWAYEGIKTVEAVEDKLAELELSSQKLKTVFSALNIRRAASFEEADLLLKWLNDFGFLLETVCYVAKNFVKSGGMQKLDLLLSKYFENKVLSVKEIEDFEGNITNLSALTKSVCREIGVRYENMEVVIEKYILPWQNMGFDDACILQIASWCFLNSIRTLEGVNIQINKFFKMGLTTIEAITNHLNQIVSLDGEIKAVLEKANIVRSVTSADREFYKTWTINWGFTLDVILHAAALASDKTMPFAYINKVLSSWHDSGVKTLADAQKQGITPVKSAGSKPLEAAVVGRSYSKEQLSALFTDEVKL